MQCITQSNCKCVIFTLHKQKNFNIYASLVKLTLIHQPESYNNWKGYTLGAFDNNGKPTQALVAFKE
jgi:hypothetical protein